MWPAYVAPGFYLSDSRYGTEAEIQLPLHEEVSRFYSVSSVTRVNSWWEDYIPVDRQLMPYIIIIYIIMTFSCVGSVIMNKREVPN